MTTCHGFQRASKEFGKGLDEFIIFHLLHFTSFLFFFFFLREKKKERERIKNTMTTHPMDECILEKNRRKPQNIEGMSLQESSTSELSQN